MPGTQTVLNLAFDEARDRVAAWVQEPAALIVVNPDDGADRQVLSDAAHGRGEVPLDVIDVDAGPGWYALVDADCQTTECIQGTGPGAYRVFIIDAVSGDRAVAYVWRKFVF